ncbi:MAG: hydrolase 1, exosortase A system-associated, partial [Halieaceae bacterium]|nr:hydrolase 1, exosortase A system-associated [Halieaceae bacterium]
MPAVTELPLTLSCDGQRMCGILHAPAEPAERGVVMLVGGPQYRVGSHRQFVLTARALARDGICVLRFDHRGAGDSEGEARSFEELADDLACAVSALREAAPAVREVVVWGLCDAASAAALFAHRTEYVTGVVLINPW